MRNSIPRRRPGNARIIDFFRGKKREKRCDLQITGEKRKTSKANENEGKLSLKFVDIRKSFAIEFDEIAKKINYVFIFTIQCDILSAH